jgi:hypothetical protein
MHIPVTLLMPGEKGHDGEFGCGDEGGQIRRFPCLAELRPCWAPIHAVREENGTN